MEEKTLLEEIQEERKRLYKNNRVPLSELTPLVYVSYSCCRISISKGAELLCTDLLTFRNEFNIWLNKNPDMEELFNSFNSLLY
jgi:hypothetical protein